MKWSLPLACLPVSSLLHAAGPLPVAGFEGTDYGGWEVRGDAFGSGPASGSLRGQMAVEGFEGKGLVNSFHGGDDARGSLTSPPFRIGRKFLTFLIGGGGWPDETCLNLLVDGKKVRSAAGPNTTPGGSERLEPAAWDVSEFMGRDAVLVVVDSRQGGWGHLNLDQIVQTDERGKIPLAVPLLERTRSVKITGDFLQLPLVLPKEGKPAGLEKLSIESGGRLLRYMHVSLAGEGNAPDFWYSADLREFQGQEITMRYKSRDAQVLEHLAFGSREIIDPQAYSTPNRPQLHFSPRLGWMNDINGSYWQDGRYHIFYQFNPATPNRGAGFDMHWGHSVSKDLVNWEEWPVALFPDAAGQCYSGTAVMQQQPIPGLNDGVKLPAPALFFAATEPFSQHVATSPDGGRTWKRFSRNPVVTNKGDGDRDPKVIWHAASQHYIMVLYVGGPDTYRILRSTDLQHWEETSRLPNWYECPEFIPMKSAVTGEELMLLYGCYRSPRDAEKPFSSNSCYQLGRFDGRTFTPVTPLKNAHLGPNFYAALTFVNEPENRAVMMGWARDTRFPGETFNQCASLPLLMQMKAIHGEDTLCFEPVPEINILRGKPSLQLSDTTASAANPELKALPINAALDIVLRFRPGAAGKFRITLRQIVFEYDAASKTLTRGGQTTTLHPDGPVEARFVIDRGLVESFWNGGEAAYALSSLPADGGPAFALEGDAAVEALTVFPMSPITLK